MPSDWKDLLAAATGYSPEAEQELDINQEDNSSENIPQQKNVIIQLDKKQRAGKTVTLIYNLELSDAQIKLLAKELKALCGAGGSTRSNEILIQGDVRQKCMLFLKEKGWKVKII